MAKYLRVVCPRYKQLVISIETLLDISQLSIEEVTGRLKAADDVEPAPPQAAGGKLLLTEEKWLERYKKQEPGRGGSSSGGHGKARGCGKARGGGGGTNSDGHRAPGSARAGPDDECKRCGKKGHWAQHCRGKLKVEAQAHVAQDDEPTLMFAFGAEGDASLTQATDASAPIHTAAAAGDAAPRQLSSPSNTTTGPPDVAPHQLELVEADPPPPPRHLPRIPRGPQELLPLRLSLSSWRRRCSLPSTQPRTGTRSAGSWTLEPRIT